MANYGLRESPPQADNNFFYLFLRLSLSRSNEPVNLIATSRIFCRGLEETKKHDCMIARQDNSRHYCASWIFRTAL